MTTALLRSIGPVARLRAADFSRTSSSTNDEQVAFAKRFGALEFELAPLSNVREDGSVRAEEQQRYGDPGAERQHGLALRTAPTCPCKPKVRCSPRTWYPMIGGQTGWADMRAAYDCAR